SGVAVKVRGQEVMTLADAGGSSARQRAQLLRSRLRDELMPDPRAGFEPVKSGDVSVEMSNNQPVLKLRDATLITITHADAKLVGLQPRDAAERFAERLEQSLQDFKLGEDGNMPSDFIALVPVAESRLASRPGQLERPTQARTTEQAAMEEVEFASVRLNNQEVMRLFPAGDLKAKQRADMVRERLRQGLETGPNNTVEAFQQTDVNVATVNNMPVIRLREANVITVTHRDAELLGAKSADDLAQQWASALRENLAALDLKAGQPLAMDLVTVATGTLTVPTARTGGGAGTAPKVKPKQEQKR
ncbi:MAG: hypothetical protein ACLGIN_08160, partial [Candidatus Sericytochromatia bacterium]